MRKLFLFGLIVIILSQGCSKSTNPLNLINCDGLVTDTLGTNDNGRIYMPNAFTPNGDGLNDISRPLTVNISSISFTIYDENNNVVFTTAQLNQGWATTVPSNSFIKYYYKIQGVTTGNHRIGACGDLYKLSCRPANAPVLSFEDQITPFGFTGPTHEALATCL
ncbi:MAG TPA: gliding motility-associated C-terminal domain-containing protein [Ferruginibacter sp.]|nr:gliding motility-associated C-terminal domain-containing protein [Ferruginibacter sp.]